MDSALANVTWADDLPGGWKVVQLRRVIERVCDGPFGSSLKSEHYSVAGVRVVRLQNISPRGFDDSDEAFLPLERMPALERHAVRPGDLLIAGLGDSGHPVGRACVAPEGLGPAIVKADCFCASLAPMQLGSSYVSYFLNSSAGHAELAANARGTTRQRVNLEIVRSMRIALPPFLVQQAIADFLDRKTASIDALIEKKERLLELLQEKRQALITRAVTKGLDPNVPMKDSGIEWLGEIPAHWEVKPTYSVYSVQLGKMLSPAATEGVNLLPYLRNRDVQWDSISVEDLPLMNFSSAEIARYALRRGDLLVCEGGDVGRAAVWNAPLVTCCYQKALHRLRPLGSDNPRFFYYLLKAASGLGVFDAPVGKSTILHLTGEQLRSFRLPYPGAIEQARIVERLDSEVGLLSEIGERVQLSLDLLREYRQALITAAVTGQIDVTEPAA